MHSGKIDNRYLFCYGELNQVLKMLWPPLNISEKNSYKITKIFVYSMNNVVIVAFHIFK